MVKTLKFSDTVIGERGEHAKREWTVTGSDEFGLPLAPDNDVLMALLAIGKEQNFQSRKICFSRYRLCKIMGWNTKKGENYKRIEGAFDRFTGVRIKAKNAFWDNKKKAYTTINFGILDNYELFDSSKAEKQDQDTFPFSYVNLNEAVYDSIKAGYIKNVDIKKYCMLESSIAKRLYRYLDKKKYDGKKKFEISLYTLAYVHIGFDEETYKYASDIKRKLNSPHEELIKAGFLKSAEYQKTTDGNSEKVIYTFYDKAEIKGEPHIEADPQCLTYDSELLTGLMEIGVTRKVAEQIVREYSAETVRAQMDMLPYRKAKDPAAALVSAIQDSWAPPVSYKAKVRHEKSSEAEKFERKQEEEQKAELRARIEGYLAKLSQDEIEALTTEAGDLAKSDGSVFLKDRGVPEPMLKAYVHVLVERRLGLQQ